MASPTTINEDSVSDDVIVFKSICMDLYDAQISDKSYDEIVNMVLETPYGDIARSDTLTLNEIGYIFDITRERVRQIEASAKKRLTTSKATLRLHRYLALSGDDRITTKRRIASMSAQKVATSGLKFIKQPMIHIYYYLYQMK